MLQVVKSLLACFFLLFKDSEARKGIFRPALKTLKVYVYSLCIAICIVAAYFITGESANSLWMIMISVSGSLLFLILLPLLVSYIYLSFFCDRYYQVIIGRVMESESVRSHDLQEETGLFRIVFLGIFLVLVLVLSIFIPLLSMVLGGFIFGADIFSQTLSCLKYSYRDQASYLFKHFFPITGMGVILLSISLFPFAVLLVYPFGVMVAGRYYSVRLSR